MMNVVQLLSNLLLRDALKKVLIIGSILYAFPAGAQEIEFEIPSAIIVPYDPFSGLATVEQFEMELNNLGSTPRNITLVIVPEFDAPMELRNIGGDILDFDLRSPDLSGAVTLLNRFEDNITLQAENTPLQIEMEIFLADAQYADAGDYTLNLDFTILDTQTGTVLVQDRQMQVTTRVDPRAQTNIAGTASGFESGANFSIVDFGTPVSGETRKVFLQVRANAETLIQLHSENNGKIVNLENSNHYIDYSVNVDGVSSDLSSTLELSRRPARSLSGTSYPFVIELGNVSKVAAGRYEDIIHIDVYPQ